MTVSDVDVPAPDEIDGQLRLFSLLEAMGTLSERERVATTQDYLHPTREDLSEALGKMQVVRFEEDGWLSRPIADPNAR